MTLPKSWWRIALSLLRRAAIVYCGVLLVMLLLENWFLFPGVSAAQIWQEAPATANAQDVELTLADGTMIHAWWCPPAGWKPEQGAVLYCHGNGGNLSYRVNSILRWHDRMNAAILIFDYPGYGKSTGKPSEPGCYAAANAAYDWLIEQQRVPAERLILYGGSLGGAIAIDLACQRPHRALVLVSAFTSLPDMAQEKFPWLPARWLVRNRFDNLAKIANCRRPIFLAHGTDDLLIPFAQGERLIAAAKEPKQFFPMPGLGHEHTPIPEFYTVLREFLAKNAS